MIIKQSKKTLYRDNVKMRSELENLLARNSELVILLEQSKEEISKVNENIKLSNKGEK